MNFEELNKAIKSGREFMKNREIELSSKKNKFQIGDLVKINLPHSRFNGLVGVIISKDLDITIVVPMMGKMQYNEKYLDILNIDDLNYTILDYFNILRVDNKKPCLHCNKETHYIDYCYESHFCDLKCRQEWEKTIPKHLLGY